MDLDYPFLERRAIQGFSHANHLLQLGDCLLIRPVYVLSLPAPTVRLIGACNKDRIMEQADIVAGQERS